MLLKKIILRNQDPFEQTIESWALKNKVPSEHFDGSQSLFDLCHSLVIIHADHNISRENKELKVQMEKNYKPTREIDINGTMNASITSFKFWLENHDPENVLIVGDDKLVEQTRFQDYLDELSKEIK